MGMSSRDRQAWALLLPLLVIILTVTGYPLISTVRLSFTDASLTGRHVAQHWVGFENYAYVFTDPDFGDAFRRTLYFTFVSVGIEILLGVLVALLLNREFAGRTIVRAIMVLPWALPTIVNAMMWRLIYNPEFGSLERAALPARAHRFLPLLARHAGHGDEHGDPGGCLEELPAGRHHRAGGAADHPARAL